MVGCFIQPLEEFSGCPGIGPIRQPLHPTRVTKLLVNTKAGYSEATFIMNYKQHNFEADSSTTVPLLKFLNLMSPEGL